jgi:phosphohistidine phosphatase
LDLLLVRHAHAESLADAGNDAARPLSDKGRELCGAAADGLRRAGLKLDVLYHSPMLRAQETSLIFSEQLGGKLCALDELAEPPSSRLLQRLRGHRCAAIGHAPWIGELAAWLLTGQPKDGTCFPFPTGAIAHLEGLPEPAKMQLRGFWSAEVLDALAR